MSAMVSITGTNRRQKDGKTMTMMTWVKGVVVTVGLALGGSAMAAGPGPGGHGGGHGGGRQDVATERAFERTRDRDFDRGERWDDGWLGERKDRFDRSNYRLFNLGKKKISDGRALQLQGERMLQRARFSRSYSLARRANALIDRGEALEREGRVLVRRARIHA